jgi:hypothetical protein
MWQRNPKNKYNNHKITTVDGQKFDSKREYNRYQELILLQRSGLIADLQRQVKFQIVPKINGVKRARFYIADFVYTEGGRKIIEDVKSPITRKESTYTLKKDLIKWQYPDYEFREVL